MILGVTGNYASGKDTVAEIIIGVGFTHISFSDILREELKKQKKEITRDSLTIFGNELREKQIIEERTLREEQDLEYQKSLEMDNNDNDDDDKTVFKEISLEEMRKIRLKRFQKL